MREVRISVHIMEEETSVREKACTKRGGSLSALERVHLHVFLNNFKFSV